VTWNVRREWIGDQQLVVNDDSVPACLTNFAYGQTADLLEVEPRLLVLARLVERARPTASEWVGVEHLVPLLVGPSRVAQQFGPQTSVSLAVQSALFGATTRRRYLQALRTLADGTMS
jgi:hypothetical protein